MRLQNLDLVTAIMTAFYRLSRRLPGIGLLLLSGLLFCPPALAAPCTPVDPFTWGGSQFVAMGEHTILSSLDGVSWTAENAATSHELSGIVSNGRQFVAVGGIILLSSSQGSAAGVFRNGTWFLDANGNGAWDGCGVDRCYVGGFGQAGNLPMAGRW